jgi:hypothetical protein
MPYMVTFTINIPQMFAYIYIHMDPIGNILSYITIMCGIWNLRLAFQKVKTNPDVCIVRHFTQPFMIDSQDKTKLTEVYWRILRFVVD